jgi:hypothetical protein
MYTQEQINKVYELLTDTNNSICGLSNLDIMRYLGYDRPKKSVIKKLSNQLFSTYSKEYIMSICRSKQSRIANTSRNSKPIRYSDASKKRMSESMKRRNSEIKNTPEGDRIFQIKRDAMLKTRSYGLHLTDEAMKKKYQTRKSKSDKWHSDETIKKMILSNTGQTRNEVSKKRMSDAKKGTIPWNKGIPCKDSTKEKLSDAISYLHQIGNYPFKIKSKGHAEIEQILLELNYDVISEFKLGKYSYDLYIKDILLIIEFHGTYWHLDPKIYKEDYYDKSKNRYAKDQWDRDDIRKCHATSAGYKYSVIWQSEWESMTAQNKINKLKSIIENGYRIP